jgi:uncharacterized membrane protein
MKKSLLAVIISLLIFIFPLRIAFLEDSSNVVALLAFLLVVVGYFAVIFLFNSDEAQPDSH